MSEQRSEQAGKRANGQRNAVSSAVGSEFRRLLIWQKAQDLAQLVSDTLGHLPHSRATDTIAAQLLRAAGSIAANIAEGYGRYSQAAYRNHLSIARGSAFEVESWLDLLARRGDLTPAQASLLFAACTEVQKLLTIRMKSLSENRTYAVRETGEPYEP